MHAVYLCHFCPFSPSIDREPQKSFYIFLPSIVSPCSSNLLQSCTCARTLKSLYLLRVPMQSHYVKKGEIVFVCSLRSLWSCYAPRAFAVFVCSTTSKSLHTSRATLYSLYITYAVPIQSKAQESLPIFCHPCSPLIPRAPLQSPFAPQPQESPPCHTTLCSLYIPESLYSLRTNKSRKVFAYSFALAVFIVTKYLCSLHTLRPPQ